MIFNIIKTKNWLCLYGGLELEAYRLSLGNGIGGRLFFSDDFLNVISGMNRKHKLVFLLHVLPPSTGESNNKEESEDEDS